MNQIAWIMPKYAQFCPNFMPPPPRFRHFGPHHSAYVYDLF